jgi:hypothetical protein
MCPVKTIDPATIGGVSLSPQDVSRVLWLLGSPRLMARFEWETMHERIAALGLATATPTKSHTTLRTRTVVVDEYRARLTEAGREVARELRVIVDKRAGRK